MSSKSKNAEKGPAAKRRLDLTTAAAGTPPRSKRKSEDAVDLTKTPAKQKRDDSSLVEEQSKLAAPVTPSPKKARRTEQRQIEKVRAEYVPTYIYKNVQYKRKGQVKNDIQLKTFELVEQYFVIPDDFETNRKYGPLSGTSFEERAIAAYSAGLLEPKSDESALVKICSNCATEGHKRTSCPKLV